MDSGIDTVKVRYQEYVIVLGNGLSLDVNSPSTNLQLSAENQNSGSLSLVKQTKDTGH